MIDGALTVKGLLSVAAPRNPSATDAAPAWAITFNGDADIDHFLVRDQRVHKDFLTWQGLHFSKLALDVLAQQYSVAEVQLHQPYARLTIRADKTVNWGNLLISEPRSTLDTAAPPVAKISKTSFNIGRLTIHEGSSDFTDLSLILPFSAHIQHLNGGISGLSSTNHAPIKVALAGSAYELAPVAIRGTLSPWQGLYDVAVDFNGLPMPLVSSYMVQFAGYKVEKGKMTLALDYHLADKKLTASNHFVIDQFELGERMDNPNAVDLPLKLAVALLKDSNGIIKLDVPISGDLDNPQFSLSDTLQQALFNMLSQLVRSPFSALAALVTDAPRELSQINFQAGDVDLEVNARKQLDAVAQALKTRTNLQLDIKGVSYQAQDWPALSDDALLDALKQRRAQELNQHGSRKIRPEYVVLSDEVYRRLLSDWFIEKFPLLAEKSIAGIPQLRQNPRANFYEVAKQKLQTIIQPEQQRLKDLANERAQAIAAYLRQQGIPPEQLFLLDSLVNIDNTPQLLSSRLTLSGR
jgi:hypothetical protein